jgi:hypothetical protein
MNLRSDCVLYLSGVSMCEVTRLKFDMDINFVHAYSSSMIEKFEMNANRDLLDCYGICRTGL